MEKEDFLRVVATTEETEYSPVAGMLQAGYGFAGYFNDDLNKRFDNTCLLINVRLVDLRAVGETPGRPRIADFTEFVEDIVMTSYAPDEAPGTPRRDIYGHSIPLAAIPFREIVLVYPVTRIGKMVEAFHREEKKLPSFLDFDNRSVVLKVLRTKLW